MAHKLKTNYHRHHRGKWLPIKQCSILIHKYWLQQGLVQNGKYPESILASDGELNDNDGVSGHGGVRGGVHQGSDLRGQAGVA